jgi:Tol biopolymer transport system component
MIGMLSGNEISMFAAETDVFHPAFIPGSSDALVELAGPVSKIVRVDLGADRVTGESFPVEVEHGQQPVLSPDGRWLAFIRENHGRGSLWIKSFGSSDGTGQTERELVDAGYNVLEAAFDAASREIVFSAQPAQILGGPMLFKLDITSPKISQITFDSAIRYPAFSSDGNWLAYSRLERGSWQIWIKPLHSGSGRQVTSGGCNSIEPTWMPDSKELIYATDCGRGVTMTALARVRLLP